MTETSERHNRLADTTKAVVDLLAERLPDGTSQDVAVIFCTLGSLYLGQMPLGTALGILMELGNYLIAASEKPDRMEIN